MDPNRSVTGQKPITLKRGQASVFDLIDGNIAAGMALAGAKTVYYVDGNAGSDTGNTGTESWDNAYKTLAVAFAASHADIASGKFGWAARNVILCRGDWFVEDLVLGCQKTDVIGVGSCDGFKGAGVTGNFAFATTTAHGTRFYNMIFRPTAAAAIFTLTSTTVAIEFHNCTFLAAGTLEATCAIDATASSWLVVDGCDFMGAFSGDVIDIGAGSADGTRIVNNTIIGGADNGIVITGVATITDTRRGLIANNFISVADKTIDTRAVSVFDTVGNRLISGEAVGASSYVIDLTFAADNILTGNDIGVRIPSITDITTA